MSTKVEPMDKKELLDELVKETQRRQRRRTDLSAYDDKLKEMLDLNISLPVILDWLAKQESITTLPALRRHVVRTFGQDFYNEFLKRNGWLKTKSKGKFQPDSSPKSKSSANTERTSANTENTRPLPAPSPGTVAATKSSLRDMSDIDPAQFE